MFAELGEVLVEVAHLVSVGLARHLLDNLRLVLLHLLVVSPLRRCPVIPRGRRNRAASILVTGGELEGLLLSLLLSVVADGDGDA